MSKSGSPTPFQWSCAYVLFPPNLEALSELARASTSPYALPSGAVSVGRSEDGPGTKFHGNFCCIHWRLNALCIGRY